MGQVGLACAGGTLRQSHWSPRSCLNMLECDLIKTRHTTHRSLPEANVQRTRNNFTDTNTWINDGVLTQCGIFLLLPACCKLPQNFSLGLLRPEFSTSRLAEQTCTHIHAFTIPFQADSNFQWKGNAAQRLWIRQCPSCKRRRIFNAVGSLCWWI